ncbi:MAG: permease [Clostridiales bacterium]|nr:permease [Clostridiales bacterium]
MWEIARREATYLWYYFDVQLRQIFWYWVLGMALGSFVSVFLKDRIHNTFRSLSEKKLGIFGIVLSAVFQRYVPQDMMTNLFGGNEAWGVLMAATIGVPLYACGGGTIPLLQAWLSDGMSLGSAAAFMITGPATKITNLGAVKIVLGMKRFLLYIAFVLIFAFVTGLAINI